MTLVSPGVEVKEIDLTTVIPAAASTDGAFVGKFYWGPAFERVLVGSEDDLSKSFHTPDSPATGQTAASQASYAVDFLIAANFLSYARRLWAVRTLDTATAQNAGATATTPFTVSGTPKIYNADSYDSQAGSLTANAFLAKYPGALGNAIGVSVCAVGATVPHYYATQGGLSSNIPTATSTFHRSNSSTSDTVSPGTLPAAFIALGNTGAWPTITFGAAIVPSLYFAEGSIVGFTFGGQTYKNRVKYVDDTAKILVLEKTGVQGPVTASVAAGVLAVADSVNRAWRFSNLFSAAPLANQMHLVVYDATGAWTGSVGSILESFRNLDQLNVAATYDDGTPSYYATVLKNTSRFLWPGELALSTFNTATKASTFTLNGGANGTDASSANILTAWQLFTNPDQIDISLVIAGVSDTDAVVPNYIIDNIAEARKDCVAFVSPRQADVVNQSGLELDKVKTFRNLLPSTSFAFLDSGWKFQFDRYNNTFRWVPLCGDIAGITARTDLERDAWFPPAGFNRGSVKNVVKLAWNPSQAQRDELYSNNINPVVDFDGTGTILYGDKTLLAKSSAFDRINVRRLFIILEKAISKASKFSLFELNDEFTRARFVSLVEPFLREIQGRRGITDFVVVCDESNNTGQVIDTNRFVGDIYIKPARSINFITLNFVAVPTGVSFSEIVGQF